MARLEGEILQARFGSVKVHLKPRANRAAVVRRPIQDRQTRVVIQRSQPRPLVDMRVQQARRRAL